MFNKFMDLQLVALDPAKLRSTYSKGAPGLPKRMCYLHPLAAMQLSAASQELGGSLVFSDMYRSAAESLKRLYRDGVRSTITKPPGFSGHNYGLSFDLDIERTTELTGLNKPKLDAALQKHGIYCHRRDSLLKVEAWHYNCLPKGYDVYFSKASTANGLEQVIKDYYQESWYMTPSQIQRSLNVCGASPRLAEDGKLGPKSIQAIKDFQSTWALQVDGKVGPTTGRVLQLVAAQALVQK
jgi:hypothetical protein